MTAASERVAALLRLNRPEEAVRLAVELLPSNPDDSVLRLNAALALSRLDRTVAAIDMVDSALRDWPEDSEVHRIASMVHARVGEKRRALDHAQRAVSLDPEEPANHRQLAMAAAARRTVRSLRAGERAGHEGVRLAPDEAESHNALGAVQLAKGSARRAARSFEEAVRLEPNEAVYHQNLASALTALGRTREAGDHLVAAGRANPTDTSAIASLRKLGKGAVIPIGAVFVVQALLRAVGRSDDATQSTTVTLPPHPTSIPGLPDLITVPDAAAQSGGSAGGSLVVILVVFAVLLLVVVFVSRFGSSRWAGRRGKSLSPEARRVLETDKEMRKRR